MMETCEVMENYFSVEGLKKLKFEVSDNEWEVYDLLFKIINRIENGEYVVDAFFREIQNTKYEEIMYKKPIKSRGTDIEQVFKGCIYVFVNGENLIHRFNIAEEYRWLGKNFEDMVGMVEMKLTEINL